MASFFEGIHLKKTVDSRGGSNLRKEERQITDFYHLGYPEWFRVRQHVTSPGENLLTLDLSSHEKRPSTTQQKMSISDITGGTCGS